MLSFRRIPTVLLLVLASTLLAAGLPRGAAAQGTVQVRALNVPPQLPNPFVEDLARAYQQGRYPVQVVFSTPSLQPQTMRIRVELERDGRTLFETTSTPVSVRPGVQTLSRLQDLSGLRFEASLADLVDQVRDGDLRSQIRRTGALPEGSYTLTLEALPEDPFITSVPSTSSFLVQYAQPPVVLTPSDGATVTQTYPIFGWTPVVGPTTQPIDYDILLVERMPGQTPREALAGNRAYVEQTVQATTFVYGPELLPLRTGRTYVWQITARDPAEQLPISDGGQTEIQTFRYEHSGIPGESLATLKEIVLEPGFARLTNLEFEADETATAYRLNGEATLELDLSSTVTVDATLRDLEIQKTGLDQPVVLGGAVAASLKDVSLPLGTEADIIALAQLDWAFGEGFVAEGQIQLPGRVTGTGGRSSIDASGTLRLSAAGVTGTLIAEDDAGLARLGGDPVELTVTRLEAQVPSGRLLADGTVRFFGQDDFRQDDPLANQPQDEAASAGDSAAGNSVPGDSAPGDTACRISDVDVSGTSGAVAVRCDANTEIPVFEGSDRLTVSMGEVQGTVEMSEAGWAYDLRVGTQFDLQTVSTGPCGVASDLQLSSESGVAIEDGRFACTGNPTIDAGLVKLHVSDLRADRLAYDAGTWDVALSLDALLSIPAFGVDLPEINDITLDRNGLTVPARTEQVSTLPGAPYTFELAGFTVTVNEVDLPQTTFPFFTFEDDTPGPWDIGFDVEVDLPDAVGAPACLQGAALAARDFRFRNETFSGTLAAENLSECRWTLGGGYSVEVDRVAGTLDGVSFPDSGVEGTSSVAIDGALRLGEPFTCDAQTPGAVTLPQEALVIENGGLTGSIANALPQCPVRVGPFVAGVTQSDLEFEATDDGQEAALAADATLQLPDGQGVDGAFELDLTTGRFTELNFELRDPFQWDVPRETPVLTFRLNRAEIGLDGFLVDGRQELVFENGATQTATFDELRLDLRTQEIVSGEVFFDGGFGLQADIDPQASTLRFRGVPEGVDLRPSPGALVELGGQVRIDSTGLYASGRARAALDAGRWTPDSDVEVEFSPDFRIDLVPFRIAQGQADILYDDAQIAYFDATGFHLGAGSVASLVPERLPLPSEQVAYLQLRKNGQEVVTATSQSDGTLLLATRQGQSVDLVIPALDDGTGAPRMQATLDSVRVTAQGTAFTYESGTITAQLAQPLDLNPQGIPLVLNQAAFGAAPSGPSGVRPEMAPPPPPPGLYLNGTLTLFEQPLGTSADVTFAVDAVGTMTGTISLQNIDAPIMLDGGTGRVVVEPTAVQGTITVPRGGPAQPDVTVDGSIAIRSQAQEIAAAELGLQIDRQGLAVTRFVPSANLQAPSLDLGAVGVGIDGINALPLLRYDSATDQFDFRIGLDLRAELELPDGSAFDLPLRGVEVRPGGLKLPAQQVHASTSPALDEQQTLSVGPVDLRLFDVELTQDVTIDWYASAPSVQGLAGLQLSLGLSVPGYPALGGQEVSIYDAGFSGGIFTGQLTALSFLPGTGPRLALGGTTGLALSEISGSLTNDGGTQGFDVDFSGTFDLPDALLTGTPQAPNCPSGDVTFSLSSQGGLEGTVSDFAACAELAYGPFTLTFPTSTLELAVDAQGAQQATLDAQARADLTGSGGQVTGTGTLGLDLIAGDFTSASIGLNGSFDVGLPQDDPVFTLRVNSATLLQDGIEVNGTGSLMPGGVAVPVQFNQFTFNPLTPEIVRGSATVQGTFATEIQLSGSPEWEVVATGDPVSGGSVLRVDFPTNLTIDRTGLAVDGQTVASLNYQQNTYATLTTSFQQFRLGLQPFGVLGGRIDFQDGTTRIASYDRNGFHFDVAGIAVATLPDRIPLPSEDVAYLKIKDDQGDALVEYSPIQGGYRLNSVLDAQGAPKPVELVLAGVDAQNPPSVDLTLTDLDVNDTFQQVIGGVIDAQIDENLSDAFDVPVRLTRIRYERNAQQATYTLTADGNVVLPRGLGGEQVTFTEVGFGTAGLQGTIQAGQTPFASQCGDIGTYQPQPAVAAVAYAQGALNTQPTESDLTAADLGLSLRTVKLQLDPNGPDTFAILGDLSSRLTIDPNAANGTPTQIPFIAGYASGDWTATLCTDLLPDDPNGGQDKVSIVLAEMYLDPSNGGRATLTVTNEGDVDVSLAGTVALPDVMGGEFETVVDSLTIGTSGIRVTQAGAGLQGQEATLFSETLKLRNDNLQLRWNNQADALELDLSGSMWLVPYQCDGDPVQCQSGDGAAFQNFVVDTRGNVALGSAQANLLGNDGIAIIGDDPDPNLEITELLLETSSTEPLAVRLGGTARLPDVMEGATTDFGFRVTSDGSISASDPLHFTFGQGDNIGDNQATEFQMGSFATVDVKEAGLAFENGSLSQPAVYSNAAVYVQNKTTNAVRFGTEGAKDAASTGVWITLDSAPQFNVSSGSIDEVDLGLIKISQIDVTGTTTQRTAPDGSPRSRSGFTIAGTVELSVKSIGSGSARWAGLTVDREGLYDSGRLDGNVSLTINDIITLNVGKIDYKKDGGTVTVDGTPLETTQHFVMENVGLTLPGLDVGAGVQGVYFLKYNDGGAEALRLTIQNASVDVSAFACAFTFDYRKDDAGNFSFLAAGETEINGVGKVGLLGAFAKKGSELSFGLLVGAEIQSGGVPIIPPNLITMTGLYGGFFYNPTPAMMSVMDSDANPLPDFSDVPDEYRVDYNDAQFVNDINVAVYLGVQAKIVDAGAASLVKATILLGVTIGNDTQSIEVLAEGELYGQASMKTSFALSLMFSPTRTEVNGYAGVKVAYPGPVAGLAEVGFKSYTAGGTTTWTIDGNVELDVVGFIEADGSFLICNDGFLASLTFSQGADIWVIAFNSEVTLETWWVKPTQNFGAYFEANVSASLFGGAAELGANLKGAFISRETLFYGTAAGYVKVLFVFEGSVSIWASFKKGEGFKGGKGSNGRYERMISDAREDAQNMGKAADDARKAVDEASTAVDNFEFTDEQIQAAGLELIGADPNTRSGYATRMLANEQKLGTSGTLASIASDVVEGSRTSIDEFYSRDRRLAVAIKKLVVGIEAGKVSGFLENLTAKAVEWDAEALRLSQDLRNPVTAKTTAQYTGSGDDKELVSGASFNVDGAAAQSQEDALASLNEATAQLDQMYRQSIASVGENLTRLDAVMSRDVILGSFFGITFSSTANDVAEGYVELIDLIRTIHGDRARSQWGRHDWALDRRRLFTSGSYREQAVQSSMSFLSGRTSNQTTLAEVGEERFSIMKDLIDAQNPPSGSPVSLGTTPSSYRSTLDGYNLSQLRSELNSIGTYLWHDVPKAGLQGYAGEMKTLAEANDDDLDAALRPLLSAHRNFTGTIDELFAVKSSMAVTLYGMIEEYLGFRENAFGAPGQDSGRQTYADQRDDLLKAMEPPQIVGVVIDRPRTQDYAATAKTSFVALHSQAISEVSYSVMERSAGNIYGIRGLRTMGADLRDVNLHAFKETANQEEKDLHFALRVRGPAGNTATWIKSTTLTVDPDGPATNGGYDADIINDTSPPSAYLSVPYEKAAIGENSGSGIISSIQIPQQQTGQLQIMRLNSGPQVLGGTASGSGASAAPAASYTEAYWLADSSAVDFGVFASDPETDVTGYEYALGSTSGSTDVSGGFQRAVGRRAFAGQISSLANVAFEGEIRGLRLQPNTPYYLSVRVSNGVNQTTTDAKSVPLVWDNTPPSVPRPATTPLAYAPDEQRGGLLLGSSIAQVAPDYDGYRTRSGRERRPTATLSWKKSIDRESGIEAYEYVVGSCQQDGGSVFADAGDVEETSGTSVTIDDRDGLSFFEARCAYVRARNHAGATSDVLRFGPIEPTDPTNPTPAYYRPEPTATGVRVYVSRAAADRETKIRGYRYRIRTVNASGSYQTFRDYPQDGTDVGPLCTAQPGGPSGGSTSGGSTSGSGTSGSGTSGSGTSGGGTTVFGLSGQGGTATIASSTGGTSNTVALAPGAITPEATAASASPFVATEGLEPTGCLFPYEESKAPYFLIPTNELPVGQRFVIDLIAVNYDGLTTQTRSRAAVVIDDTPPPSPTIQSHSFNGSNRVSFTVTNVRDPQSGIVRVEYAVRNVSGQTGPWTPITSGPGVAYGTQSFDRTNAPTQWSGFTPPTEVGIRITNSNGLQRVVWSGQQLVFNGTQNNQVVQQWQSGGSFFFP